MSGFGDHPLDRALLSRELAELDPAPELHVLDEIGSTNTWLRESTLDPDRGAVVIAEHQIAGRGRHGRSWESRPGEGLYLSVALHTRREPSEWTRWTIGAGLAAAEAIQQISGAEVELKWPNDVLLGGRKLAGLLVETRGLGDGTLLIVGCGINVHQRGFSDAVEQPATSLANAGHPATREALAVAFVRRLRDVHDRLEAAPPEPAAFARIASEWEAFAPRARGWPVLLTDKGGVEQRGRTDGLAPSGALQIHVDGERRAVHLVEAVRWLAREESDPCC